jgi:mannosyltransferase OCH1-like enzyme
MIPHILHSMWYDAKEYDNVGPPIKYPHYFKYNQKWEELHPTWTHQFWNRRRIEELWDHPKLASWKSCYDSLTRLIERCDYSRYAILWMYGGVYRDLDMVPVRAIDSLLENREFGWSYEPQDHTTSTDNFITNSFLCSTPEHWIWPQLMTFIQHQYDPLKSPVSTTGPAILYKFAEAISLTSSHPHYFIDTCLVIPLNKLEQVTSECSRNVLTQAYSYTRWNEGTNWDISSPVFLSVMRNKNLILTVIIIAIFIIFIAYWTMT